MMKRAGLQDKAGLRNEAGLSYETELLGRGRTKEGTKQIIRTGQDKGTRQEY
jgi:hypothetical protein